MQFIPWAKPKLTKSDIGCVIGYLEEMKLKILKIN